MHPARLLPLTCILLLAPLSPMHAAEPAAALKALQGTWKGTEAGQEDKGVCTLTIKGGKIHFAGWDKDEWYKGTVTLLPNEKPKQLHGKITDCPAPGFVGKTSKSIYKIEKGVLTIAGHRPGDPEAPSGFDDEKARRFVLKKVGK